MRKLWLGSLVALLMGCSASTLTPVEKTAAYNNFTQEQKLEQVDRISSFRFDSWTSLGKQHLILYRNFNEPYLVKLKRDCFDLDFTMQIGVGHKSNTLLAKFDYIVVPDTIPVRCYIDTIHKIDKDQKKALMAIGEPPKNDGEPEASVVDQDAEQEQAE